MYPLYYRETGVHTAQVLDFQGHRAGVDVPEQVTGGRTMGAEGEKRGKFASSRLFALWGGGRRGEGGGGAYATSARARLANRKGGTATTLMVRPIKSVAHPSKLHDAHNNHSFTTYPFKPNRRLFLQKGTLR